MFQFDVRISGSGGTNLKCERASLGSARVSRAGDGVLAVANFLLRQCHVVGGGMCKERLLRRGAATTTRDACATQNPSRDTVFNSNAR
jgi:hypothetical protein